MDDLELLIGLVCDGEDFETAVAELHRKYCPAVRRLMSRFLPFCDEAEISREAEIVLAQFTIAVQSAAVPDESAISPTLIKECRRRAAHVVNGIAGTRAAGAPMVNASARLAIRDTFTGLTACER